MPMKKYMPVQRFEAFFTFKSTHIYQKIRKYLLGTGVPGKYWDGVKANIVPMTTFFWAS